MALPIPSISMEGIDPAELNESLLAYRSDLIGHRFSFFTTAAPSTRSCGSVASLDVFKQTGVIDQIPAVSNLRVTFAGPSLPLKLSAICAPPPHCVHIDNCKTSVPFCRDLYPHRLTPVPDKIVCLE
jgi:hypothetical protein